MIKINLGDITNPETKVKKDIVVQAASPNKLKDILIGGGFVLIGITYLTVTAFKNGVKAYEDAELCTLSELGLLGDPNKLT